MVGAAVHGANRFNTAHRKDPMCILQVPEFTETPCTFTAGLAGLVGLAVWGGHRQCSLMPAQPRLLADSACKKYFSWNTHMLGLSSNQDIVVTPLQ